MLLRKRFIHRLILLTFVFGVSLYVSLLLFGNLKTHNVLHLTDLHRCPACYGVSVCPELYSNLIVVETNAGWSSLFNVKNIYYGNTKSYKRVILKKLAHDVELKEFDQNLCKFWKLKDNCKPLDVLNVSNIDEKVIEVVRYNHTRPDIELRKNLVLCPYTYSFYDLMLPILKVKEHSNYKSNMINVWTMLMINPEPIILQAIPKAQGWPVPAYGGVCGRLEVLAYEGDPLSSLTHVPWPRKLMFAKKILEAAMDFTFKHDKFRFYLLDWSLDNIVANDKDDITFVDLEDVIVLDKHISPKKDLPDWYQRYRHDAIGPGFAFSIPNICKHHLSDHNIWAACYILAGDSEPLLFPIPKEINKSRPHFDRLLSECLAGNDRFSIMIKLQHLINDMLADEKVISYGTER